jgi:hypothetical protein
MWETGGRGRECKQEGLAGLGTGSWGSEQYLGTVGLITSFRFSLFVLNFWKGSAAGEQGQRQVGNAILSETVHATRVPFPAPRRRSLSISLLVASLTS